MFFFWWFTPYRRFREFQFVFVSIFCQFLLFHALVRGWFLCYFYWGDFGWLLSMLLVVCLFSWGWCSCFFKIYSCWNIWFKLIKCPSQDIFLFLFKMLVEFIKSYTLLYKWFIPNFRPAEESSSSSEVAQEEKVSMNSCLL